MTPDPIPTVLATPKRPGWLIPVLVAAAVLILALAGVAAWALLRGSSPAASTASGQPSAPAAAQPKPAEVPAPKYTPTKLDFLLKLKVTEKKCFGSAGCLIEYHIDLTYAGAPLDDSQTWVVTYEVSGVEDGPAINTFEVTGDQMSYDESESAETPSSSTKLKVKVTDVEEK